MAGVNEDASSSPSNGHIKTYPLQLTSKYIFVKNKFLVLSAKINGVGGFLTKSPDVYVEFVVDSEGQAKRTAVKKKTSSPQWDQTFTINVQESSIVEFKVICKAKVFDDSIMGSKSVKVSSWLKKDSTNGKCKYFYQFFFNFS